MAVAVAMSTVTTARSTVAMAVAMAVTAVTTATLLSQLLQLHEKIVVISLSQCLTTVRRSDQIA